MLTRAQQIMLADSGDDDEPIDDWTPFGLRKDGKYLRGPDSSLQRYMAFKREQKGEGP